jgi:septal ring factor EnvC (AmiA/AmiB activator)
MVVITEEKLGKWFAKAFREVVLPALEDMEKGLRGELASKKDLEDVRKDLGGQIDSLDRKFNAVQDRLDNHGQRIEKLESRVSVLSS